MIALQYDIVDDKKLNVVIPRLDRGIQKNNWMPDQVRHDGDCKTIVEILAVVSV